MKLKCNGWGKTMAGAKGEKMEEQKQANNGANYAPGGANTQKEEKKGIKNYFFQKIKYSLYHISPLSNHMIKKNNLCYFCPII